METQLIGEKPGVEAAGEGVFVGQGSDGAPETVTGEDNIVGLVKLISELEPFFGSIGIIKGESQESVAGTVLTGIESEGQAVIPNFGGEGRTGGDILVDPITGFNPGVGV